MGDEFQLITGWGPKISSAASLWDAWSTIVEAARELRLTMVSGVRIPPRPFFRWRSYVSMIRWPPPPPAPFPVISSTGGLLHRRLQVMFEIESKWERVQRFPI
ncbi:hypothetical protein R6Q59_003132 [Mikania micrantha]